MYSDSAITAASPFGETAPAIQQRSCVGFSPSFLRGPTAQSPEILFHFERIILHTDGKVKVEVQIPF